MRRFYRLAMLLPVLVPVVVMAGAYIVGTPIVWFLQEVVVLMIGSAVFGAVPYALLALWANRWIEGKTEDEIQRKALRAPLFMLVATPLFVLFLAYFSSEKDWLGSALFFLLLATPATVVVGYAWVGLIFFLRRVLVARRWLELTAD